jgi:hypothetical protein
MTLWNKYIVVILDSVKVQTIYVLNDYIIRQDNINIFQLI